MESRQPDVQCTKAGKDYFAIRGLEKYAGVWSLWALGVGAAFTKQGDRDVKAVVSAGDMKRFAHFLRHFHCADSNSQIGRSGIPDVVRPALKMPQPFEFLCLELIILDQSVKPVIQSGSNDSVTGVDHTEFQ